MSLQVSPRRQREEEEKKEEDKVGKEDKDEEEEEEKEGKNREGTWEEQVKDYSTLPKSGSRSQTRSKNRWRPRRYRTHKQGADLKLQEVQEYKLQASGHVTDQSGHVTDQPSHVTDQSGHQQQCNDRGPHQRKYRSKVYFHNPKSNKGQEWNQHTRERSDDGRANWSRDLRPRRQERRTWSNEETREEECHEGLGVTRRGRRRKSKNSELQSSCDTTGDIAGREIGPDKDRQPLPLSFSHQRPNDHAKDGVRGHHIAVSASGTENELSSSAASSQLARATPHFQRERDTAIRDDKFGGSRFRSQKRPTIVFKINSQSKGRGTHSHSNRPHSGSDSRQHTRGVDSHKTEGSTSSGYQPHPQPD